MIDSAGSSLLWVMSNQASKEVYDLQSVQFCRCLDEVS